ncbi:MAG: hypothetical protein R3A51_16960 [Nannocystaceae bacterium]
MNAPVTRAAAPLPGTVIAFAKKGFPEEAAAKREEARSKAKVLIDAGDPEGGAKSLARQANELGDPLLFLDAGENYRVAAEESRDTGQLEAAREQIYTGLDILYFLKDPRVDEGHMAVPEGEVSSAISRGKDLLASCDALEQEIEDEKNAPPPPEPEPEKKKGDGKGMIIAGSVLTGIGVAGLGIMGGGIGIGASAQSEVNKGTVYGEAYDDADKRGKLGNTLAYAGVAVAAVGLVSGVTLLVLGLRKRKKSRAEETGGDETARVMVTPIAAPGQGGLALTGRF